MDFKWHQTFKWFACEAKIRVVIKSKGHILMKKKDGIKNIYLTFDFDFLLCSHIRYIVYPFHFYSSGSTQLKWSYEVNQSMHFSTIDCFMISRGHQVLLTL